jgi:anti-sigma28 factor (negative regulator of flagellin synthesis)
MSEKKSKKRESVWLVNVSATDGSLMFQFPTQEEQMNFVEQIKGRVESYSYALDPCKLVSKKKSKKFK